MSKTYRRVSAETIAKEGGWKLISKVIPGYQRLDFRGKISATKRFKTAHPDMEYVRDYQNRYYTRPLSPVKEAEKAGEGPEYTLKGLLSALDWAAERIESLEKLVSVERERADQFEAQISLMGNKLSERARRLLRMAGQAGRL